MHIHGYASGMGAKSFCLEEEEWESDHGPEEAVAACRAEHVVVGESPAWRGVHLEQQEEAVQHGKATCATTQSQTPSTGACLHQIWLAHV